jgi:hypothetical protein
MTTGRQFTGAETLKGIIFIINHEKLAIMIKINQKIRKIKLHIITKITPSPFDGPV